MKITKKEMQYLGKTLLTWTFVDLTVNLLGLWFTKLLNKAENVYPENIFYEFVKPILIQSALFGICITIAFMFLKNKKLAHYTFVVFQFVVFHIIFFLNLRIHQGIHFESTFNNPGIIYLSYSGQYLIDILYLYFPINGNFKYGMFMPDNIGTFYLHWILLNILYYFGITWVTIKTVKLLFNDKLEQESK